jgi:uncharacterized membrane protein YfcA
MTLSLLGLALVVLLACTTQALAGFGSTVICVTLAALWLPIPWLLPIIVALNVPFSAWLIWRQRRAIAWALLRREVLPLMVVGAVIGALCAPLLMQATLLRPLYGALIIGLSILDLWRLQRARAWHAPAPLRSVMLAGSGFVQGLYASGGPLLAAALAGSGLDKRGLRATMLVVWLTLNSGLTLWFIADGRYHADMVETTLWLLPVSFLGLWIGDALHDRVDERQFRLTMDVLLLLAGAALLAG